MSFEKNDFPGSSGSENGLIWGVDSSEGELHPLRGEALEAIPGPGGFRWLHMNLADERARRCITRSPALPAPVVELMLSADDHPRAMMEGDYIGCVVPDLERDFDEGQVQGIGALHFTLGPSLLITARRHPLRSADIIRDRLASGSPLNGPRAALELLIGAITEVAGAMIGELSESVETIEDELLARASIPQPREMMGLRRDAVRLRRLVGGLNAVFQRLEADEELPGTLLPAIERIVQRLGGLDADIQTLQSQLRLVREEMDLLESKRTNQNLYVLSVLSALLLPATLVTGIFGMNTGGLPWATSSHGTLAATLLVIASAVLVYLLLRRFGLAQR